MWLPLLLALPAVPAAQEPALRATVQLVIAPTTVSDKRGKLVDGLQPEDFRLTDNGVPQKVRLDVAFPPISLVVALQTGVTAEAALPRMRHLGSLLQPLILGARGDAAVVTFDDRVRVLQDFTSNGDKLAAALKGLQVGGAGSRMLDGVAEAVRLLRRRPEHRRRVVLLVCESRDRGSETKLEDAITDAQRQNITIYPVTFSPFMTKLTTRRDQTAQPPGPKYEHPRAVVLDSLTPGAFNSNIDLKAMFTEIARLGKENAAEALAKLTGGARSSFVRQNALERAVAGIGEELHGQYLLSYTPQVATTRTPFHTIEVKVVGRPDLLVRTRPAYWEPELARP